MSLETRTRKGERHGNERHRNCRYGRKALIGLLNKAFSDEWLAYFQYWIGAKVVKGPMKEAVIAELVQHAADELRHADMLAQRIIQLGGTPVNEPKE